jgi:hypothetical protein
MAAPTKTSRATPSGHPSDSAPSGAPTTGDGAQQTSSAAVTDRPAGGSTGQRDNAGHAGRGEVRDAERDEIRDAERDAARDAQRDEARDAERDAERDETRDEQRDAARDMTDCGTPRMNDRWRCLRRE